MTSRKKLKTGGPSGDDPATSVTAPPPPAAASGMPTTLPSSTTTQSIGDESIADKLIPLVEDMWGELDNFEFSKHSLDHKYNPVVYKYNPVASYAKKAHYCFIRKYGNSPKSVLFLGLNPGPSGTEQISGVPFADPDIVQNWFKITGVVEELPEEPPRGVRLGRTNSGVSGKRFWKLCQDLSGTAENFFKECFVYDYCPLTFLDSLERNLTPFNFSKEMKRPLHKICDDFLCRLIQLLEVKVVVGIGTYAEARAKEANEALAKAGMEGVRVVTILHPSPSNPATNKGWQNIVEKTLEDHDLMKYMK